MHKLLLLLFLPLLVHAPAYASANVSGSAPAANIAQRVASRLLIREDIAGQFLQKKQLSFMTHPIVSSGSFTLSASAGLRWLVEEPLRSEMHVLRERVLLDGNPVQDQGVGQLMATIMQAFMTGDLGLVENDFNVTGAFSDDQWQVRLEPKSLLLQSVLDRIELQGDDYLHSLAIFEVNKAQTLIEFHIGEKLPGEIQGQGAGGS